MNDNICTDNRFEMIEKYLELLKQGTNIETSQEEMQVIENILFRFWQMGWLDKIETAEVKRGKWIENDNGTYSCSLCQSWIPKEQYYYARYCLHCGADMRGETK